MGVSSSCAPDTSGWGMCEDLTGVGGYDGNPLNFTCTVVNFLGVSFFNYFVTEITHGYQLKEDKQLYSEKQRRVTTFMKTPREVEKVWTYGPLIVTYKKW